MAGSDTTTDTTASSSIETAPTSDPGTSTIIAIPPTSPSNVQQTSITQQSSIVQQLSISTPPGAFQSSNILSASAKSPQSYTTTSKVNSGNTTTAVDTSQTPSAAAQKSNNGFSGGAVAGAAVGCLLGGLLLGVIFGFFLWRYMNKKKKNESTYHHEPPVVEKAAIAASDSTLDHVILQATPDNDIKGMLKRLEVIIEQHVESCYHLHPIEANITELAKILTNLGIGESTSGFGSDVVAGWCLHPNSRRVALQHVISHVLFSSIDGRSGSTITMLPEPVAAFLRSIRPVEQNRENFDAMTFALTRWRTLSVLLLHPNPSERTPLEPPKSTVQHQGRVLADALNVFLQYFISPDQASQQQQHEHLQVLITDTAKLGFELLSHTSDWRFIYQDDSSGNTQRGIVICVGLEKLSHRNGHRLASPECAVAPRVVALQ